MNGEYETLKLSTPEAGTLVVALNRPAARNALDTQMGLDAADQFEAVGRDPGALRAIVITGVGDKAFCAGGDLKERRGMTDEAWNLQHLIFERLARALVNCPVPLLAAVNGAAFGGGCEIALACDFIYAAESARFALPEVSLGIIPGMGGTQNLARAVGERRAKELIMTGRAFTAAEAHEWGMLNRVLPDSRLLDEAIGTAVAIARNAPLAVRQAKQSIYRGLQMSLSDGLAFEIEAYNRLVPTNDRREGVLAFNERRRPEFTGK